MMVHHEHDGIIWNFDVIEGGNTEWPAVIAATEVTCELMTEMTPKVLLGKWTAALKDWAFKGGKPAQWAWRRAPQVQTDRHFDTERETHIVRARLMWTSRLAGEGEEPVQVMIQQPAMMSVGELLREQGL